MKKVLLLACGLWIASAANAQFFDRLVRSAGRAAENAVERNVEKKVEEGVDKAFDENTYKSKEQEQQAQPQQKQQQSQSGWTCPACGHTGNTGKFCTECGAKKPEAGGAKAAQPAAAQPEKKVECVCQVGLRSWRRGVLR